MRFGALLLVGFGLLSLAACTANTSSDLVCESMAGVCLTIPDAGGLPATCGEQLTSAVCDPGLVCCSGSAPSTITVTTTATDAGTPAPTATDAGTKT